MVPAPTPVRDIGRYRVYQELAAGGMATVSFGRLLGPVGFSRTVAIKQLHAQFAKDPEFVAMFLDEARLAARIHHPNVVATLDVVAANSELVLVMDYVHGEALGRLLKATRDPIPPKITAAIIAGALHGLHAAHEARSERGLPLGIVHRDISPQNIIVGADGIPRVLDFGVAKAANRLQTTQEGHLKGKIRYMSPEQIQGLDVNRQTDLYAIAIVLFEMATGRTLYPRGAEPAAVVHEILHGRIPRPSAVTPSVPPALDAIILRGLERDQAARYPDAHTMALELEESVGLATATQVAAWVQSLVQETLSTRASTVSAIESSSTNEAVPHAPGPPPAMVSSPSMPSASELSGRTATTSFSLPHPPEAKQFSPVVAALLAVFGVLAVVGIGLSVYGLSRARSSPVAVAVSAPPAASPAVTIPVASAPALSAPSVTVAIASSAVANTPPKPIAPAATIARPKPKDDDDDMARSRR